MPRYEYEFPGLSLNMVGIHIRLWLKAVGLEAVRLMIPQPADSDSAFFAFALRNLYRAAEAAEKATGDPRIRAALEAFDAQVPDAKDLRDVLEHFDAYLDGTGKLLHPEGTPLRDRKPENARDPWEGKRPRSAPPFSFGSWASFDQAAAWVLIGAGELQVEVGAARDAAIKLAAEVLAALGQ